jgi:hypothetical protein
LTASTRHPAQERGRCLSQASREVFVTALSVVQTASHPAGPAAYPDDLAPGMQDELAALADIETRFEGVVAHLDRRPGTEVRRQRLEAWRMMRRQPHVLRLAQLHQRMMAVSLHREARVLRRGSLSA